MSSLVRVGDDGDLNRLGEEGLPEAMAGLPAREGPLAESWMPEIVLAAQVDLAGKSQFELAAQLANVAVAVALRLGGTWTPKKVYAEFGEKCKISDEAFLNKVAPELRRVIARAEEFSREQDPPDRTE